MINTKGVIDQHKIGRSFPFNNEKLYELPSFELRIYATH